MSEVQEEGLSGLILPRTGRGSQYVKALRAYILESIDSHGSISREDLEMAVCLEWDIMSRSFATHFNDVISFGLVTGKSDGLQITQKGRSYLRRVQQDESLEQTRMKPKESEVKT